MTVERATILDRLEEAPSEAVVAVTAPAGYGKTTLLSQAADRASVAAYLRITSTHADPAVLMQDLAAALGAALQLEEDPDLSRAGRALEPGLAAATQLAEAIGGHAGPALLILDDVHLLQDRRAADALTVFVEMRPIWLRVMAAGHDVSALHPARIRATGRLVEIGEAELAFDTAEIRMLARALDARLTPEAIGSIEAETSGWPVAVSLALRSLGDGERHGPDVVPTQVTYSIADYVHTELLGPLDDEHRAWLLRSSVLDVMTGPLCDAALETTGSAARLRELESSRLLISRIDRARPRYRYHSLLRSLLRDELEVVLPGQADAIAARAAKWHDDHGEALEALEYARAAGDRDLVARLMARHSWPLHWSGRIATLERWVDWFDQEGLRDRYASVAVLAGFLFAIDGRRHAAELWLASAEHSADAGPMPDGSPTEAWVCMLRAMMVTSGVEAMAKDARRARAAMRSDSPFMPGVRLLSAVVSMLSGRLGQAATEAHEAVAVAEARGAMPGLAMASGIEAALELRAGNVRHANAIVDRSLRTLRSKGLDGYVLSCLLHAVAARLAAMSREHDVAHEHLARVARLRPLSTASVPWLSLCLRLEAIEALVAMSEIASARTLMREVDEILRVRPRLGALANDADDMRVRLDKMAAPGLGGWTLTTAELRVLQYLPTHLTFAEIAERLFVSPHTVKSQAVAIYSKLGVSTRRAAIEAAVEHGLLDPTALRFPLGPGVDAGIG